MICEECKSENVEEEEFKTLTGERIEYQCLDCGHEWEGFHEDDLWFGDNLFGDS